MSATDIVPLQPSYEEAYARAMMDLVVEQAGGGVGYRDAESRGTGEISLWPARNVSADAAVIRDGSRIRARVRDLVRNNPIAKNAVRMARDSVSGSGLKLAPRMDWRTLGIDIEAAEEWHDHVIRQWEAFAESDEFAADARRQQTFSQLFMLVDREDFSAGEALAIVEMKPSSVGYQTCLNLIDIDRLDNPIGQMDTPQIRAGIERDHVGEPIAYYIREAHPADITLTLADVHWKRVERRTTWGRPIVLHTYEHERAEQSRGVSQFASAIVDFRMLQKYEDTELQSAIAQAAIAAVIKTELDWGAAMGVLGAQAKGMGLNAGNPISDAMAAHMRNAAEYAKARELRFQGVEIPHLLPNESIDVVRPSHPNSNFPDFENAFIRKLAAGLGVEAHELGKNYREVNYSSARAALEAVWRTYKTRRNRLISQFARPFYGAWLEEAVAIGTVPLPKGVTNFLAARPFLIGTTTFIAWGKPMIDPLKERQANQIGLQNGLDTYEAILAEQGKNWRDEIEQVVYERARMKQYGLAHPMDLMIRPPVADPNADPDAEDNAANEKNGRKNQEASRR